MNDNLTPNEQKVVDKFESLRQGYGELAKQRIISSYSGWREIIADYSQEEINEITEIVNNDGHSQT